MRILITTIAFAFTISLAHAQTTAPSPEPTIGAPTLPTGVAEVKNFGEVVEKKAVIRIIDKELNTVCYVAHGASFDSGTGIHCMPLPRQ